MGKALCWLTTASAVSRAFPLFAPNTNEAVAEGGGLIARAQAGEVGSQLDVEFTKILLPEVSHQCLDLPLVHSHDLPDALSHFCFRHVPGAAIFPHLHEPFTEFPWFQMETCLPLFNPSSLRRDFEHPTDIKDNRSNGHVSIPFRNLVSKEV